MAIGSRKPLFIAWAATIMVGISVAAGLPTFFRFIDARDTVHIVDPLLAILPPRDVSIALFAVLYGTLSIGILHLLKDPFRLLRALQAYVILLVLRMITMTLVTLEPPPGLVILEDPVTQWFYPGAVPFAKDLFFSGHTATLFLLFLALGRGWAKWLALVASACVGFAVLVQHVHWTVDVLAAPVAAWSTWWSSGYTVRLAKVPLSISEEVA